MMKLISPKVALEVGVTPALVFQHICYWMQTQAVDVIYRTNKELASDLECLSESQIQRAKKKLIEFGLISISKDKQSSCDHTTHYRLTSKGKSLLLSVKQKVEKVVSKVSQKLRSSTHSDVKQPVATSVPQEVKGAVNEAESVSESKQSVPESNQVTKSTIDDKWIPKHQYHEYMKAKQKQELMNKEMVVSKDMKASFDEGMLGNKEATKGIPTDALKGLPKHLLKKLGRGGV